MMYRRSPYRAWRGLRDLRITQGLTRRDLAAGVGVSYVHMCQMEQGRSRGSDETLLRIASFLGVDPAELARTRPETLPPRGKTRRATARRRIATASDKAVA